MLHHSKLVLALSGCALILTSFAADARTFQTCTGKFECDKLMFDCGQDSNSIGGFAGEGDDMLGFCIFPR